MAKTKIIQLRILPEFFRRIQEDAKSLGLTLSDYYFAALNEKLERRK